MTKPLDDRVAEVLRNFHRNTVPPATQQHDPDPADIMMATGTIRRAVAQWLEDHHLPDCAATLRHLP